MQKITNFLQQLDLSESEAQMYLSLLKAGPLTVRDLARMVGIKRTSAYMYVERLVQKGLIIKLVKKSRTLVSANAPHDGLQHLVEQKLKTDKLIKKELPDIIKSIQAVSPDTHSLEEVEIRNYKGKQGVKRIYEEALKLKELRSYVNIEQALEAFPENAELFNKAIKKNPKMIVFEICADSPGVRDRIKGSPKNHLYRILPQDMKLTYQDVLIYDNKVAIINLKDELSGIVLHNTDLYNNFKLLFDFLWKMLPK